MRCDGYFTETLDGVLSTDIGVTQPCKTIAVVRSLFATPAVAIGV